MIKRGERIGKAVSLFFLFPLMAKPAATSSVGENNPEIV